MTTTDPFTEAARAEAWRRHPDPVDIETGEPVDDWGFEEQSRRDFQVGAEWGRDYYAAQEPTDAEVEAAAKALHAVAVSYGGGGNWIDWEHEACAALSAARAARRDEEKR